MEAETLIPHLHESRSTGGLIAQFLQFVRETSKPIVAICVIIVLTAMYKAMHVMQILLRQLKVEDEFYTCETNALNVPTTKQFPFKVNKLIVDESDILVTSYVNGSVYVWDLFSNQCQYYINRRYFT